MTKKLLTQMGEKEKKYDRQLRLWGDHGQRELENARVCMVHVTATGTEILKNLVLPGKSILKNQVLRTSDSHVFCCLKCIRLCALTFNVWSNMFKNRKTESMICWHWLLTTSIFWFGRLKMGLSKNHFAATQYSS